MHSSFLQYSSPGIFCAETMTVILYLFLMKVNIRTPFSLSSFIQTRVKRNMSLLKVNELKRLLHFK